MSVVTYHVVVDDVVVHDDVVMHHVVVRVPTAGECEYEGRARYRRPSKPLHHHALPPDFRSSTARIQLFRMCGQD